MNNNDERDYAEEATNQKLLEENEQVSNKVIRVQTTSLITIDFANYDGYVTVDKANAAGVELPIDTPEKVLALERYWIHEGVNTINDFIDTADEWSMTLIDDPKQH